MVFESILSGKAGTRFGTVWLRINRVGGDFRVGLKYAAIVQADEQTSPGELLNLAASPAYCLGR